ncbi:unnamed protein product [Rotaria sordida]|uniref:Uncharacterized protein n=1 Tax=Rotaria sordida TaxID=392033 RepID=A0A814VJU2_9BILA|nr:unnamed protein product [Rotaria sordida]CAF1189217.1 unnamed protein product [Rotaria sordida]
MYDNQAIYAVDELNQQAYTSYVITPTLTKYSFAMKNSTFAILDSPESKKTLHQTVLQYELIHSKDDSRDKDYWYANEICEIYTGEKFPCQEIYFKKNIDIPLRTAQVVHQAWDLFHETTHYKIISIGKPDERIFNRIPTNWAYNCTDVMLSLSYNAQILTIKLTKDSTVDV